MTQDLQKTGTTGLEIPSDLADIITTEKPAAEGEATRFAREDIAIPRLSLVQKTSKEIEAGESRFIEGAKFLDIFHTGDRRLFGQGPIYFSVLRCYDARFVEFRPMDQGGGIIDLNVPPGDERTLWNGTNKPVATKYLDFIVLLLNGFDLTDPMKNVAALSLKSTALKAAKELNRLISWRGKKDLFRGVYKATTASDKNAKGSFTIWKFVNYGWLNETSPVFPFAEETWNMLKEVDVTIEREEPSEEDDFDPEELERESQAAAVSAAVNEPGGM